tara:strand:- start:206 stop:379 length:174 start_codon:yes stop_codon:yes gene_type:complete
MAMHLVQVLVVLDLILVLVVLVVLMVMMVVFTLERVRVTTQLLVEAVAVLAALVVMG